MNSHFLIIILKTYLKKRNERETEKDKEMGIWIKNGGLKQ